MNSVQDLSQDASFPVPKPEIFYNCNIADSNFNGFSFHITKMIAYLSGSLGQEYFLFKSLAQATGWYQDTSMTVKTFTWYTHLIAALSHIQYTCTDSLSLSLSPPFLSLKKIQECLFYYDQRKMMMEFCSMILKLNFFFHPATNNCPWYWNSRLIFPRSICWTVFTASVSLPFIKHSGCYRISNLFLHVHYVQTMCTRKSHSKQFITIKDQYQKHH